MVRRDPVQAGSPVAQPCPMDEFPGWRLCCQLFEHACLHGIRCSALHVLHVCIRSQSSDNTGTYAFQAKMVREGVEWFGDLVTKSIVVGSSLTGNKAVIVTNNLPDSMLPGSIKTVRMTFRNLGSTTWSESTFHRLGAYNANRILWTNFACGGSVGNLSNIRAFFCSNVSPGSTYTAIFDLKAPSSPGVAFSRQNSYRMEWSGSVIPIRDNCHNQHKYEYHRILRPILQQHEFQVYEQCHQQDRYECQFQLGHRDPGCQCAC